MASAPGCPHAPCCLPWEALPPCPGGALPSLPSGHLALPHRGAEPRCPAGTPGWRLDAPSWERTGTPPAPYQVLRNCWSTWQSSASQENKFICLKCEVKKSFTIFRTSTGKGNNSGRHNCLVHCFGFQLCSLQLTDELLLKVILISSQPRVQFFQDASVSIAASFPSIRGNPNALSWWESQQKIQQ